MMMTKSLKFPRVIPLSILVFVGLTVAGFGEGQLKPVPPADMLSVLPKTATDWKLLSSKGETFYSSGLMSRAVREFEYAPTSGDNIGQGATCILSLTDTAGNTSRLGKFVDFREESGPGFQKIRVKSFPAIVRERPKSGTLVSILIDQRFTLDITLRGFPLDKVGPWIEATNLQALSKVPDAPIAEKLRILEMVLVDEMNPENSRTYPLVLSDRDQIAAGLENVEDMVDDLERDDTKPQGTVDDGGAGGDDAEAE